MSMAGVCVCVLFVCERKEGESWVFYYSTYSRQVFGLWAFISSRLVSSHSMVVLFEGQTGCI